MLREGDHDVAVLLRRLGDLFVGDAAPAHLRLGVDGEVDEADLLLAVVGDRLVHRRTTARAEVLVGRAVVLLAVAVERIAARHLEVRVGVDGDQVVDVHAMSIALRVTRVHETVFGRRVMRETQFRGCKDALGRRAPLRCGGRPAVRADCTALLGLPGRRRTHCVRCVHCVQTCCDKSVHEARCARGPEALRCSSPQRRCARRPSASLQAPQALGGEKANRRHRACDSPRAPLRARLGVMRARCPQRAVPLPKEPVFPAKPWAGAWRRASAAARSAVLGSARAARFVKLTRRSLFERERTQ